MKKLFYGTSGRSPVAGLRWSDQTQFQVGLERAGQQAIDDFERTMEKRKKGEPGPGRIVLE